MDATGKQLLQAAARLYAAAPVSQNTQGGSGNLVFEVEVQGAPCFLRASAYSPANETHIQMELAWMHYLASRMDGIVAPLQSAGGNLCETASAGGARYILCLLEKAPGSAPGPDALDENLYYNLGGLMGNLHRLTARYPGNVVNPLFAWDNDAYSWRGGCPILDADVRVWEKRYKQQLRALPMPQNSYGLIHYDIHAQNFFVQNGKITLFDFDACQFNWYAADIASAVFFMVQRGAGPLLNQSNQTEKARTEFAESHLIAYLKGYLQTNALHTRWLHTLDLFMKYQMTADEYRAAQSAMQQQPGPQQQWYLNWHRNRIVNNLPYVFIDYNKVARSVPGLGKG